MTEILEWVAEQILLTLEGEGVMFHLIRIFGAVVLILTFMGTIIWLITMPRRRQERTRLFLHLLETGLREGMTPQQALKGLYGCPDPQIRHELDEVIYRVSEGETLSEALRREPSALPPRAVELIGAGERIGNLQAIMPLVRRWCADETARMSAMLQYPATLFMVTVPIYAAIAGFYTVVIFPKFAEIFQDMMDGRRLPALSIRFAESTYYGITPLLIAGMFLLLTALTLAGAIGDAGFLLQFPRTKRLADWIVFQLPWRRCRLQRDFAVMLGILIDMGISESEAVTLAARTTDNTVMTHRAAGVVHQLEQGTDLPSALSLALQRRDLAWLISTTVSEPGRNSLAGTLEGWSASFSAKAERWEQTIAHVLSSLIIVFIGFLVMTMVITMWLPLIELIDQGGLW